MDQGQNVRPSPIAGQWYSADAARLATQVDNYIHKAHLPNFSGKVIAIMAPHAGHRYSGPVAGHAFAALYGSKPELVCIVSPMHYPYNQPLLTTAHQAYATPLGTVPVDLEALEKLDLILIKELGFSLARVANDPEHSLEIELPFLQRALETSFKLLPVMVRDQSAAVMQKLGLALAEILRGRAAVLVASTDLSHFYPQTTAHKLDSEVLHQVEAFDPAGVIRVEELGKGFACGYGALASVMWAARALGADHAQILNYATSGDITGDFTQVVGYGAALFTAGTVESTGAANN
jgi:MEMO1 family protein